MKLLVGFIVLLVGLCALGEQVKVSVTLGFGRVKVESKGSDQWPSEKYQELETDLLIDERFAPFVTGKLPVKIEITQDEFVAATQGSDEFDQLKNLIFDKTIILIRSKQLADGGTESKGGPNNHLKKDDAWNDDRIVVGSTVDVAEGEFLEEVVVIAGKANIRGTVARLVVIGGEVHLYNTAKITEELNIIGGHVIRDEGAQVIGKQVNVSVPLSQHTWQMVFDGFEGTPFGRWFMSPWGALLFFLLKFIILMVVAFFSYWIAPSYQDKVYTALLTNPVSAFFWGLFSIALVLPTTVILCLSIIGLPFLPLQFSLICLFALLGYIQVGHVFVKQVFKKINLGSGLGGWPFIALGIVALELISLVPIIGGFVLVTFGLAGFGSASKIFYQQIFKHKGQADSLKPLQNNIGTEVGQEEVSHS